MLVMKFGGTSLSSATRFSRAVTMASRGESRRALVVVSAIAGTTDALIEAAVAAEAGDSHRAGALLQTLDAKHRRILGELDARASDVLDEIDVIFQDLYARLQGISSLGELTPRVRDRVIGQGELLSALLFATAGRTAGVPVSFVDARELVVTDARFGAARPDRAAIAGRVRKTLLPRMDAGIIVTQGFVGATENGEPTTLGRGGSDYSASLLGAAIGASEIQIWTDVPGMLTADRRVVRSGKAIGELSFREAAELAYFGAKVLHPATIEPALTRDIPVRILDAGYPEAPGTLITSRATASAAPVKSIASKRGITVVHLRSLRMLMAHGFLKQIFEVFDRLELSIDLVATSEVSVSLTLDDDRRIDEAVAALSTIAEVRVERGRAILCLVGEGLGRTPGIAARALASLDEITPHMVSQGASEINLSLVLAETEVETAVQRVHREFFGDDTSEGETNRDDRLEPQALGETR